MIEHAMVFFSFLKRSSLLFAWHACMHGIDRRRFLAVLLLITGCSCLAGHGV